MSLPGGVASVVDPSPQDLFWFSAQDLALCLDNTVAIFYSTLRDVLAKQNEECIVQAQHLLCTSLALFSKGQFAYRRSGAGLLPENKLIYSTGPGLLIHPARQPLN